jgi:hypothetical protein
MKAHREVEMQLHIFLTVDEVEWSSSLPGRFIPGERPPRTISIGGWVGPTAGLSCLSLVGIEPTPSSRIPVTKSYHFMYLSAYAYIVVAVTVRCPFRSHSGEGVPRLLQFWRPPPTSRHCSRCGIHKTAHINAVFAHSFRYFGLKT